MTRIDTSGSVFPFYRYDPKWNKDTVEYSWSDLSTFTQGYVEELLASLVNKAKSFAGVSLWGNRSIGFSDLAPETLARIIADCEAYCRGPVMRCANETAAARIFWEHRQKGWEAKFPPLTVQLGDDGKVRFAA